MKLRILKRKCNKKSPHPLGGLRLGSLSITSAASLACAYTSAYAETFKKMTVLGSWKLRLTIYLHLENYCSSNYCITN